MRPGSIDEENEHAGLGSLEYTEDSETVLEPPSSFSDRMYAYLVSKAPPRAVKLIRWTYGENTTLGLPKPWLRIPSKKHPIALEPLWIRWTRPFTSPILLGVLIAVYIISLSFFARAQWYQTPADDFIGCTASFWSANNGCGLDGTLCSPFNSTTPVQFRCPAACPNVILANQRAVGDLEVVYKPLVVGGGDDNVTYRGDSWVCVAAVQAGVVSSSRGGCASLELVGAFKDFVGVKRNGIESVSFPSTFPLSFRFLANSGLSHCEDMRNEALAFNILVTAFLSLVLRPKPLVFFWCLVCIGFWHITFFSDPRAAPPPVSDAIGAFLPALFVCYAFWRSSFRFVLPAFSSMPIERTFWYIGGFWPGVLINLTFDKIPIDRLIPSDVNARPGGIAALIVIALVVVLIVINQIRVIRKTQQLPIYLMYYILGGLVILVLALLPGLTFRLHHYVFAMLLIPGLAFPTRISALLQAFLLGMFLNGISRWGFASILQTAAELRRDAALGTALPSFSPNMTFSPLDATTPSSISTLLSSLIDGNTTTSLNQSISWPTIPSSVATSEGWDGFSLIVDDVERYSGTALNYSISALDWSVRHFFRLAYQKQGASGDYTKAATIFPNGTFVSSLSGPS